MIKLNSDTTKSLANVMRNNGKPVHADYLERMGGEIQSLLRRIKEQAETIGEQKYQLQDADKAIAALEADADAVRAEAHDKALQWASLELLNRGFVKELCDAIDALRTAAQPKPEARFFRVGGDVVVDLKTRQLMAYDPKEHGDLPDEELYDVPTGYTLVSPEVETATFPMTDGPDLPWSLAEEIYNDDAFDYFEQSRDRAGLTGMAKGGGWSWRALADCFETYSVQCDYEAESDARLERGAESYHAGQEGERP